MHLGQNRKRDDEGRQSRHVARRATYLFGRVLIHHARPLSSERIYRHVGYRADKFNPPLRTNFADLVLRHRADPYAQIAVDLR